MLPPRPVDAITNSAIDDTSEDDTTGVVHCGVTGGAILSVGREIHLRFDLPQCTIAVEVDKLLMALRPKSPLVRALLLAVGISLFGALALHYAGIFIGKEILDGFYGQHTSGLRHDFTVFLMIAGGIVLIPGAALVTFVFGGDWQADHFWLVPIVSAALYFVVFYLSLSWREAKRLRSLPAHKA